MAKTHVYKSVVEWTGNLGSGTSGYREYSRNHTLRIEGKPEVPCSSDAAFRGDAARYNPEEMLVASLSACHMLWYLHLCADRGIVVSEYVDVAQGVMQEDEEGGRFTSVALRPRVKLSSGDARLAEEVHGMAHRMCFIANSVNFPVRCEPVITAGP